MNNNINMKNFKKFVLILFLFFPINIFAYSSFIVPGGNTVGVDVKFDGVLVIGFYKINGVYNDTELKLGDYIIKADNTSIYSINDIMNIIEKTDNESINIEYRRDNKVYNTKLNLVNDEGKIKTGLYIKDSIKGCGTLSYIDPTTNIYGVLGHEIVEVTTDNIVQIRSGGIYENKITGIEKSYPGSAGSKISKINYNKEYGIISKNTKYGIFGTYLDNYDKNDTLEIGQAKIGKAQIRTVIDNQKIETFDVKIVKINETSEQKNIKIIIDDKNLLSKTGGVVQGMSGSPIIQNNKIVGVLTHVIVDDPISGYGIFIEKMLAEGEK